MKEKELRLAIAYFGGVSLAVYQHGINREILNLIRASKLYHRDRRNEGGEVSFRAYYPEEPEGSTGDVYLEFLEAVGRFVSLRVVVDVIAGSSAGGINGIALARALANDLSLTPLTGMWLEEADMLKLLAPEAKAKLWSKWYIRPVVRPMLGRLKREGLLPGDLDAALQEEVSVFLRSRWFKPPLDGRRLTALVLDGLEAMEGSGGAGGSLLPEDTRLDLLVTATDFRGVDQSISIHDPPVMREREHRQLFRFSYEHRRTGYRRSDFDLDSLPSLAFAARASASYPGAFPPAQIREVDELLTSRYRPWPGRARFLADNFGGYRDQNLDPESAVLVDGAILDNKPIMATLEAIHAHAAFREVDRRLVFIDPHSGMDRPVGRAGSPGFFATLRAALSDLPRNDPIYRELAEISRFNRQTRRLKEAIANSRPQVEKMILDSTGGRIRDSDTLTVADLREWRLNSTRLLSASPIVYDAWMRTLVLEAVDFVAGLVNGACRFAKESAEAQKVQEVIEQWAANQKILTSTYRLPDDLRENVHLPNWGLMIIDFGVVYKKRRLNFVLSELNNLYGEVAEKDFCSTHPEDLDLIKIKLHKLIDALSVYDDGSFLSDQAIHMCRDLFLAPAGGAAPDRAAAPSDADISALLKRLALECDLDRSNDDADAVLSSSLVLNLGPRCRSAILTAYLGYFYWDVLVRPVAGALSLETGPIVEILIDRISPDDALTLRSPDAGRVLRGGAFAGFGGFLSRATRENDYLWGRLHAVDRLFDILASTAPASARGAIDPTALKKRAFERVIEEEAGRLRLVPELVARIRSTVSAL
jgi:patatin-related protein